MPWAANLITSAVSPWSAIQVEVGVAGEVWCVRRGMHPGQARPFVPTRKTNHLPDQLHYSPLHSVAIQPRPHPPPPPHTHTHTTTTTAATHPTPRHPTHSSGGSAGCCPSFGLCVDGKRPTSVGSWARGLRARLVGSGRASWAQGAPGGPRARLEGQRQMMVHELHESHKQAAMPNRVSVACLIVLLVLVGAAAGPQRGSGSTGWKGWDENEPLEPDG